MVTFESISSSEYRRPLTQEEYVAKMTAIQQKAVRSSDMLVKTKGFWVMENLSASFLRNARPGQSLDDPQLPEEVRAIAHCGIGIGATEVADFKAQKLIDLIDSFSNPAYRLFAYENVGSMLGVYEPGAFYLMSKFLTVLGILPIAPLHRPEPEHYLKSFEPEVQRLIAHGYGRLLYFTSRDILSAILRARSSCFPVGPCVHGIAFAYSMVNNSDLRRVFLAGQRLWPGEYGRFFVGGLVYALEFWEWMSPGLLDGLSPGTTFGSHLVAAAREGVAAGRAAGALAAFAVVGASLGDFCTSGQPI